MTVRVSRKDWWGKPHPGDVRLDREGNVVKVLGRKYSPDQPRVPAGSPEGGRWARTEIHAGYTADIGGMDLARKHKQTIYQLAGSTDAYGDEHAVVIGLDGNASKVIRGNGSSVRVPDPGRGAQGTIHTHPARKGLTEPTAPSPGDIAQHMQDALESGNENYTTIVASLSTGDARVKVYTLKGWPKGNLTVGPVEVTEKIFGHMLTYGPSRIWQQMSEDEYVKGMNDILRDYVPAMFGLEWEEAWFG